MQLNEETLRQIITDVVNQMQSAKGGGAQVMSKKVDAETPLDFIEKGPAQSGTTPKEVVVALPPAFGISPTKTIIDIPHSKVLAEVCAGIEEEGLGYRFVKNYQTADVGFLAHEAAKLSGSGVGIGILSRGTTVIHQKDLAPLENLELFPQAPLIVEKTFRAIGKNAAKYAKGENPSPVPVQNDPMARPRYQGLAALLHNKEVQALDPARKIVEVTLR